MDTGSSKPASGARDRRMHAAAIASDYSLRLLKIALVCTMGIYFLIVGFDNVRDYGTNFEFVRHVISMDSVPRDSKLLWRSIDSRPAAHAMYWVVIAWELVSGGLCLLGVPPLWIARRDSRRFLSSRTCAVSGLGLGILLWLGAFITIGGEWFQMWRSPWSGESAAFRMFTINALILLFLSLPEASAGYNDE